MLQIIVFQLSFILFVVVLMATKDLPAEAKNGGPGEKLIMRNLGLFVAVICVGISFYLGAQIEAAVDSLPSY